MIEPTNRLISFWFHKWYRSCKLWQHWLDGLHFSTSSASNTLYSTFSQTLIFLLI